MPVLTYCQYIRRRRQCRVILDRDLYVTGDCRASLAMTNGCRTKMPTEVVAPASQSVPLQGHLTVHLPTLIVNPLNVDEGRHSAEAKAKASREEFAKHPERRRGVIPDHPGDCRAALAKT